MPGWLLQQLLIDLEGKSMPDKDWFSMAVRARQAYEAYLKAQDEPPPAPEATKPEPTYERTAPPPFNRATAREEIRPSALHAAPQNKTENAIETRISRWPQADGRREMATRQSPTKSISYDGGHDVLSKGRHAAKPKHIWIAIGIAFWALLGIFEPEGERAVRRTVFKMVSLCMSAGSFYAAFHMLRKILAGEDTVLGGGAVTLFCVLSATMWGALGLGLEGEFWGKLLSPFATK